MRRFPIKARASVAALLLLGLAVPAGPASAQDRGFTDTRGSAFADEAAWLRSRKISLGCDPRTPDRFCPEDPVTRGQMAAFLVRALDLPAVTGAGFSDVPAGHTFRREIGVLAEMGITRGCDADRFCPGSRVTRGQMAAFLARALRLARPSSSGFADVPDRSTFARDIGAIARADITQGCRTNRYCPAEHVTRGQMAAFLQRALNGARTSARNTGPTAYYHPGLGRYLSYKDLRPSGTVTSSHDGQVIERLDVRGSIRIAHDDVTVRASRVRGGGGHYSISYVGASGAGGASIEYVEIDGEGDTDQIGVYLEDFTLRRSHVYGQRVGVNFGSDSVIVNNYVHSQATAPGSHNTAMSIHGGSHVLVRDNNLVGSTSSALSLYPDNRPLTDITVEGNYLNGGSYCTYGGDGDKPYREQGRSIRYIDNAFGTALHPRCGQFGPVTAFNAGRPGNVWTGNHWARSGRTVTP